MRNLSLIIEYDGTHFFGWQYQPNKRTVQGELQNGLRKMLDEEIKLTGAGRTDQGVHALGQVANFHAETELPLLSIKKGINALIGDDVYVKDIMVVPDDFNSRYSAKTKIYQYHVTLEPSPFRLRYAWYVKHAPIVETVQKAIPDMVGERDFRNFSVVNGSDNTICNLVGIEVSQEDSRFLIKVEGNRFLRKMVRGIVGFLVDIGRGRFAVTEVGEFFGEPKRDINFAPPQGLFLVAVNY
jgi:tRNA pseudouridine38-40 synthase